jgi:hypothetical protein
MEQMSRGLKVFGVALILTVAVSMLAADATYPNTGKTWNINFTKEVKVGTVLLPAGEYRVQHVVDGDNHLLVFKAANNREKARVPCRVEPLSGKVDQNTQVANRNDAGELVLQSLAFKGDKFRHELVNPIAQH